MMPNVSATWSSPAASLTGNQATSRLRLSLRAGPVCLLPRVLPESIASALDRAPAEALPRFDVSGPIDRVRSGLAAAITGGSSDASDGFSAWLRDDILDLADLYVQATEARSFRIRLQVVDDDMCRRFHVDDVAYRLLTTYRGPGTEWLPPRIVSSAVPNQPIDSGAIRRLERGTIAVLRGARGASPEQPGVLHRSPPIEGSGQIRLFLAINETGR